MAPIPVTTTRREGREGGGGREEVEEWRAVSLRQLFEGFRVTWVSDAFLHMKRFARSMWRMRKEDLKGGQADQRRGMKVEG